MKDETELFAITVLNAKLANIMRKLAENNRLKAKALEEASETLLLCKTIEESNEILRIINKLLKV